MPVRVFEGRATGLFTDGLGLLASRRDLGHSRLNGGRRIDHALKHRLGKDDACWGLAIAIAIAKFVETKGAGPAVALNAQRADQDILGLRAVATGVHHQGAADRAWYAGVEF